MILAIDSSSRLGLLSLDLGGGRVLTRSSDAPREHLEFIGRSLGELREESGRDWSALTRVAVTIGPGSFTGLRVGLATAKGLVFGRDIPLAPLPSLALPRLAADPGLERALQVVRRARGEELWLGRFEPGDWHPAEERLAAPAELGDLPTVGDAPDAEPEPGAAAQLAALARLAREAEALVGGPEADRLLPRYLLAPSVTPPGRPGS